MSHVVVPLTAEFLALAGAAESVLGVAAVARFARQPKAAATQLPPITILKPLYGDEPLLERALASFCAQDYPAFQIVFGVQDPHDPAIRIIERLRQRFADVAIDLVIDQRKRGPNRKIGNLLNMVGLARHELLVISDSDIHAAPDLLRHIAAQMALPDAGLVTCLYNGLPANRTPAALLGATQINHVFLPGTLLARGLGRKDCLGAVMALRQTDLAAIGGLEALLPYLADDAILGQKIAGLGKRVLLARSVVSTTVPESRLAQLWQHELRWARTIRSLAPVPYAASILQYPLFFALFALVSSHMKLWSVGLFAAVWLFRALAGCAVDMQLGLRHLPVFALLPLRDCLSAALVICAFMGSKVSWRGESLSTVPNLVSHEGSSP